MSDYSNLQKESDKIANCSKANLDDLNKLSIHLKSVHNQSLLFIQKTINDIDEKYIENTENNRIFTSSQSFLHIYTSYKDITQRFKEKLEIMKDTLIFPIDIYYKNLSTIYTDVLAEIHSMTIEMVESRDKVDKFKKQYLDAALITYEYEKKIELTFTGKQANTMDDLNQSNSKYHKAKEKSDLSEGQYKNEIGKFNMSLNIYDKKYQDLLNKRIKNEENRMTFIKDIINKYSRYSHDVSDLHNELSVKLKQLNESININTDIIQFKKEFNFSFFGQRFKKEEFRSFQSDKNIKTNGVDNSSPFTINDEAITENTDNFLVPENVSFSKTPIDIFIKSIFNSQEIEVQSITKIIEQIYHNQTLSKSFIDSFLSKKSKNFWYVENLNNLTHFANLLNSISLNFEKSSDNLYDITFAIIYIAERTYYYSINETIYLCGLLSQNKFYTNKAFWIDMIEFKLARKLEEHVKHLMMIDIVPPKEDKKALFDYIGSGIKHVFGKDTSTSTSLLENLKIAKNIHNYKNLPEYKRSYLDSFATKEIHLIMKEFIPHLCNFNFGITEIIDMVVDLSTKYKVPMEKMNYFVANIGAWFYSVKKRLPGMTKSESIVDRIKMIKEKRINLINSKYPITNIISQCKIEDKTKVIVEAAKYMEMNELQSLFILCKTVCSKGRIKIFKEMLRREKLPLDHRIKIWYCLLNITTVKKKYNYVSITNEIESKGAEELIPANILTVLKLDVHRTSFKTNEEESKKSLASILKAIAYIKPKLNYCQGMNYITSFVFQLLTSEEETFFFMIALVDHTDFALIFMEDLQKLKIFFYIFERILNIFIPDISYTFKLSSVNVNYFCPPWFLTLFTNTSTIIDLNSPPSVVLKIWDEFFLKGWRALITTGLAIINHNQRELLSLKYDQVLHFLINDVIKSNFFHNDFFETYILLIKQLKLNKKLITNLETEYQYENKEMKGQKRNN